MFTCPLHQWGSHEKPCPACQQQSGVTTSDTVIINPTPAGKGKSMDDLMIDRMNEEKTMEGILESKDFTSVMTDYEKYEPAWLKPQVLEAMSEYVAAKDAEIAALKEKVNDLTMADMTHEYNQAEAEKFAPEYERQIREPLDAEILRLRTALEGLMKGVAGLPPLRAIEGVLTEQYKAGEAALNP